MHTKADDCTPACAALCKALGDALMDAHEFLKHSGNQRALMSAKWVKPSARYDWLVRVRRQAEIALRGAGRLP